MTETDDRQRREVTPSLTVYLNRLEALASAADALAAASIRRDPEGGGAMCLICGMTTWFEKDAMVQHERDCPVAAYDAVKEGR